MSTLHNKPQSDPTEDCYNSWVKLWDNLMPSFNTGILFFETENPVFLEPILTMQEIIFNQETARERLDGFNFPDFLASVAEGKDYDLSQGYWVVVLPEGLIEEYEYDGNVYCAHAYMDETYPVRLDKFCFAVKVAAVFYAENVDKNFDPWQYFPDIDRMCLKYSDPSTFNAIER